ncbi:hypothetical protein T439DRAFT_320624 [Meredithblackwellia eburnea MCA 4105]
MRTPTSFLVAVTAGLLFAKPAQSHLETAQTEVTSPQSRRKPLTGRFIHLTDMHPDPNYIFNSTIESMCHGELGKKNFGGGDQHEESMLLKAKEERAGYWGSPVSECDAPIVLINATFDWLEANFKGEVDFVVWTGDNARHDIDSRVPRSLPEIFELNRYISKRIKSTFGNVPVVTSIGNNDIYPHNILFPGPSAITNEFLDIWRHFIPEDQLHHFAGGAYYSIEAIPGQLLLVSLNTLYMYENNKAVDGCLPDDDSGRPLDPGTEQLEWLEQQLILARGRGMQVWLTGHVPPTPANWYPACYKTYGDLVLSYHDTVVGQLFGHMNVDHFSFVTASDIYSTASPSPQPFSHSSRKHSSSQPIHTLRSGSDIADELRAMYRSIPKKKKTKFEDFSVVHINPSVIPTYLPAVRIWQYNISEESRWRQPAFESVAIRNESVSEWRFRLSDDDSEAQDDLDDEEKENEEEIEENGKGLPVPRFLATLLPFSSSPFPLSIARLSQTFLSLVIPAQQLFPSMFRAPTTLSPLKKKKKKKGKKPPPRPPQHFSPEAPSMMNRYLSPIGYTQFYIDLEDANLNFGFGPAPEAEGLASTNASRPAPTWDVLYSTFTADTLARGLVGVAEQGSPVPLKSLPDSVAGLLKKGETFRTVAEVAEGLKQLGVVPYELEDLSLQSWVNLGRKLGKSKKKWRKFLKRMFVGSGAKS